MRRTNMHLSGKVSSGLGRAHVFMAQPHYQEQFKQVLDVSAWPGTLNLDMDESSLSDYKNLRILSGLEEGDISHHTNSFRIKGFERDGKSFGGATAFLAKISVDNENWIECAILIPDLTRHTETAEVISGSFLRESLPCKDGDKLKIKLN
ncbi:CTP-dependent riboflavin kinase [Euryarchaeota archaeon]|nr:CTP-dependent riboflavin kinase [Candidatus Thalassarchaeaceae archaeon]MDC3247294.1 CTP-dependent riboflavin kinase [Euryarchaeota archaeon]